MYQQMLERIWREKSLYILLEEVWINTVIMEMSLEILQKLKIKQISNIKWSALETFTYK